MSFGLLAVNDGGKYIIDAKNRTQHFVGKATYVGQYNLISGNYTWQVYDISSPGPPLVFVYTSSGYAAVSAIHNTSGTNWRITLVIFQPVGLELYCFTGADVGTPSGTAGMKVFDDAGVVIFDSRTRPLRLRGIGTQRQSATVAHGVSGLSKPAAMIQSKSFLTQYTVSGGIVYALFYAPTALIDATNIICAFVYLGIGDGTVYPNTSFTYPDLSAPIIDGADYD